MSFWDFLWGIEQRYQAKRTRETELLQLRRREVEASEQHNELEGKKLRYLIGASAEDLREQGIKLKSED